MRTSAPLILLIIILSLTIIGCGISPDIYNSVVTERNAAQNTIVQLEKSQVDNENTITLLQNSNKELTEQQESDKETITSLNTDKSKLESEKLADNNTISELEKAQLVTQNTIAVLQNDKTAIESTLAEKEQINKELNQLYPAKLFKDRNELEEWLRNDDLSERPNTTTADAWYQRGLELQKRASTDGYIISTDFVENVDGSYSVWASAVTQNNYYYAWDPDGDELNPLFTMNIFTFGY